MLRKRCRSVQKDQHNMDNLAVSDDAPSGYYCSQADGFGQSHKSSAFFNAPRLFIGLNPKGLSEADSVRSPTSPLEFRVLSNLGNPVRTNRSSLHDGQQKCWDGSKVGLSIIDSLEDCSKHSGKVLRSSESKNIIFSSRVRIKTPNFQTHNIDSSEISKSLPKNYTIFPHTRIKSPLHKGESNVLFEIGVTQPEPEPEPEEFGKSRSCSFDSCGPFSVLPGLANADRNLDPKNFGLQDMSTKVISPPHFINGGSPNQCDLPPRELVHLNPIFKCPTPATGSLSAVEIELSEDYTCVISHGPNPKTVHIYGDCIFESHSNDLTSIHSNEEKEIGVARKDNSSETSILYPSVDFLRFCYHCNKKLEEGKDIYIYRGEKAFCSLSCRASEMMMDVELEKSNTSSEDSQKPENSN